MKLSREKIQRMVGAEIGGSAGGGGGESMGGFATQAWVDNNYVSIEWFDQIFQVFDDSTKLDVNGELPVDQSKMNIKAMFGFWTDFYISALGNGGQVGASITLASLADVNVAGVQNGQVLTWNSAQSKWIATTPSSGVDMTVVWGALAANTNEQINASHLSTALADYATQTWVGQQGYLTSTDINDMATETWVSNNYLPLTGGTLTGDLTVEEIEIGRNNEINNQTETLYIQYRGEQSLNICHNGQSTQFGGLVRIATGVGIEDASGAGLLAYHPNNFTGVTSSQWGVGAIDCQGVIRSNNNALIHYKGGTSYEIIDSSGGQSIANSLQVASVKIEQTNEINSQSGMLHLNYRVATNLSLGYGGGSVGIGTSNPSYRLHVDGVIYSTTGVYSAGYVTALSDEREKNIIEDFEIPLDYIAKAPIVSYEWKDKERRGDKQHIGSIAQYWLREMPELVPEVNGRFTMDNGCIALLCSIVDARHIVNLEQRVARLERKLINS